MCLQRKRRVQFVAAIQEVENLSDDECVYSHGGPSSSDAPFDFIQKNADKVNASNVRPTKMTRHTPKVSSIGRSTARGFRCMTSISCGSNEMTSPSATDVTILPHRIGVL